MACPYHENDKLKLSKSYLVSSELTSLKNGHFSPLFPYFQHLLNNNPFYKLQNIFTAKKL